jgi:hypothetical protein
MNECTVRPASVGRDVEAGLAQGSRAGSRLGVILLAAAAGVLVGAGDAPAQTSPTIVRVEEDWYIEIGVPSTAEEAPQIITVTSPTTNISGHHCIYEINHRTLPEYAAGGMQFQYWTGTTNRVYRSFPATTSLATANEVITYTVAMRLGGSNLEFEVINGNSTTWGQFGRVGYLKNSASTSLSNLNSYSPETSVNNSRVAFASHRVKKFTLKEVRYYSSSGLVATDTTERVVHVHTGQ